MRVTMKMSIDKGFATFKEFFKNTHKGRMMRLEAMVIFIISSPLWCGLLSSIICFNFF